MKESNINTVYLLVGQRGAGKSHCADKLKEKQPELILISRDEVLIELYGSTSLSPYTGAHYHARDVVFERVEKILTEEKGAKILLDYWTGCTDERWQLISRLRSRGAKRVIALYFITPLEVVEKWFWQKPGIAKMSETRQRRGEEGISFYSDNAVSHDYELFHELAKNINSDGFDEVIRIDPRNEIVVLA